MPDKQITNPSGLWGVAADTNPDTKTYSNNSGGALALGDVLVFAADATGVLATTTTTVNDKTVLGVAAAPAAAGASVLVVIRGPARINIAANTVTAGDLLTTSAAAKVAILNAAAPAANAVTGSVIATALEASAAKDTANTIRAYIQKT